MTTITTLPLVRLSDDFKELAIALAKAQAAFTVAERKTTNPHFKTNYANIASIRAASAPHLAANGLAILQSHQLSGGDIGVWELITTLLHTSGQWAETVYPMHVAKQDAQGFAAATTYARRISWQTLIGVVSDEEDDDGEEAAGNVSRPVAANAQAVSNDSAERAYAWAMKAVKLVGALESSAALDAFWMKNSTTISDLKAINVPGYSRLMEAVSDRRQALQPVPLDEAKPDTPPEPDEVVDWFVRALDDLPSVDAAHLEEVNNGVTDRIGDNDGMLARWVQAIEVRRKQIAAAATTARVNRVKTP